MTVLSRTMSLCAAAGLFAAVASAPAAAYPDKPVNLTVGFGPGGPSDIAARFMQKRFKAVTGQDLTIINKPGGGGAKAWSQIGQDAPDGYNLTLLNFPHTVLQPIIRGANAGYSDDVIHPVLFYTAVPQVIAVRKESPFKTFQDLAAAMKAEPGKVTFAGTGIGGSNHSAYYKFAKATGLKGAYVPFKDTASGITALKGGVVDAAWSFTTQGVKDGDAIRLLVIASEERMDLFPDVPTLKELGFPVFDKAWWAVGVPPGTPEDLRKKVSETFAKVVSDEAVAADMIKGGYAPMLVDYPKSVSLKGEIATDYTAVGKALAAEKK